MSWNENSAVPGEYVFGHDFKDEGGNPAGGNAEGPGFAFNWQDGPLERNEDGSYAASPANGAFVEDVVMATIKRMEFFQDSDYACEENANAVRHLQLAYDFMMQRRKNREERQVLGLHKV